MTDRWKEYFNQQGAFDRSWLRAAAMHWSFNETLYGTVMRYCPPPARLLDIGCGPGWSDLYLASAGYDVTGIDNEPRLLEHARSLSKRLGVPAHFAGADAFDLRDFYGRFDLAFSCGVLEHFDREVTVQLLKEQAKCAPRVLIQIPTPYTAYTGKVTDERFYAPSALRRMVEDAGLRVAVTFGYGDVTATRRQVLARRMMPRGIMRLLQNRGFGYSIAVLGERPNAAIRAA